MRPWHPILTGEVADRARQIAREIGLAIVENCTATGEVDPREAIVDRGDGGLAIACAYLHEAGLLEAPDAAGDFLDRALAAVGEHEMDASLLRGFTGIGWVANHLLAPVDGEDPVESIDDAVATLLAIGPAMHFDLIEGLVGLGTYAVSRLPRPAAVGMLEAIVGRLAASSERVPDGITWRTGPGAPGADSDHFPTGSYSLGFARGVPGVIALLAAVYRRDIATPLARELLDGAVAWVLAQRELGERPDAMFPIHVSPVGGPPAFARPAWCFGDIGVAMGLAIAARATARDDWEAIAIETARASATTPLGDQIIDAAICHGSVGLAHMLARLHHATGDLELGRRAVAWFEHALAQRNLDHGFAGFPSGTPRGVLDQSGRANWSLLFGAAGVALTLVSAATPIAPAWDQLLLVDPPDGR